MPRELPRHIHPRQARNLSVGLLAPRTAQWTPARHAAGAHLPVDQALPPIAEAAVPARRPTSLRGPRFRPAGESWRGTTRRLSGPWVGGAADWVLELRGAKGVRAALIHGGPDVAEEGVEGLVVVGMVRWGGVWAAGQGGGMVHVVALSVGDLRWDDFLVLMDWVLD